MKRGVEILDSTLRDGAQGEGISFSVEDKLSLIHIFLGGLLYFLVDYGGFYLLLNTRTVAGADPFWFLLWMSMSYGFTNFVWIWLWLDRDGHALEWSILIVAGWFTTALLSQNFGGAFGTISIARGTGSYHGLMAAILFVGYAILCLYLSLIHIS